LARRLNIINALQSVLHQITGRKTTERALRNSERQLHRALRERERLARDLHDNIVQTIYAIGMKLEETKHLVPERPDEATVQLSNAIAGLNTVIDDVRHYIVGFGPLGCDGSQLHGKLTKLVSSFGSADSLCFQIDVDPAAAEQLGPEEAENILQISREALSNALRHSRGHLGRLVLHLVNDCACLEVSDDGVGFDPQMSRYKGNGLHNMSCRARSIGAALDIISSPGQGTWIVVQMGRRRDPAARMKCQIRN